MTVWSVRACGENAEVLESLIFFGSVVNNNGRSDQEVIRRISLAYGVIYPLNTSMWRTGTYARAKKIRIFKSLVLPVLLHGLETWTLTSVLERRLSVISPSEYTELWGTSGMTMSNQLLLREGESRPFKRVVCDHQLRLHGHVKPLPDIDLAHRVLAVRDKPEWRPRGRRRTSFLGKVDRSCLELFGMGRVTEWGLSRGDRPGWRRRESDTTRPAAHAPHG